MKHRPLRVLALTHTDATEGCTYARVEVPLRRLHEIGLVDYSIVPLASRNMQMLRGVIGTLRRWDVVLVARPRQYAMLLLMREVRRLGIPIVVDLDDWLLDVPEEHPEAAFYNSGPRRPILRTALTAATTVTVSTPFIAARCAALGLHAQVLPNGVDCTRFVRIPRDGGPLTVAFCGGVSHAADLPLVVPALRRLLEERNDIRVVTVGCPVDELQGLHGYTHHGIVPATHYPQVLSQLQIDIGLAPLRDTPFNRAKSDIKYLEYSAVGAATLASPVAPYEGSVTEDRGCLVSPNTPDTWTAALYRLVDDPRLQRQWAANAYEWARQTRSSDVVAAAWHRLLLDLVSGRTSAADVGTLLGARRLDLTIARITLQQVPYNARQVGRLMLQKTVRRQ